MISPVTFLQQTQDELKKVTWPNRNEIIRLTMVVILVSFIVGLYIGALDFIFARILQLFINH